VSPRPWAAALGLALALRAAGAPADEPPPSPRAEEALALCERARRSADPELKQQLFERGLAVGEEAVTANERDPRAHFAVFCNLGERMRAYGVSLGSLLALSRLRREIERALDLAPQWPDALLGKGALLLELPRLLGGDQAEGEGLVREALRFDPDYLGARLRLARTLAARGARDEARVEAARALAIAEREGNRDAAAEARGLLD
jgi:tetratricopeptide (TPR) repeat protein